jgi:uncharacterized protein
VPTSAADPAEVLERYRTIAVVGASKDPIKAANSVPRYLKYHGYRIIPVNPTAIEILGEKAYPSLLELPEDLAKAVEVVEIFRPSEELPKIALEVVEMKKRYGRPFVFWAQQGLRSVEAERILEENGIGCVMDACMRTVHVNQVSRTA